MNAQELYEQYGGAVAYVVVQTPDGEEHIGSAFHIGSGVYITARHVIENNKIISIATTKRTYVDDPNGLTTIVTGEGYSKRRTVSTLLPGEGVVRDGPFFHPDPSIDIAALIVDGIEAPFIPLGGHLDDWINDDQFILAPAIVMGYPPIPFSREPLLVAARAEINAVVNKYVGKHPHFVVSAMSRGGFSGGPCLLEWNFALGIITESLITYGQPTELGFMTVLTVEPIYECLQKNNIFPEEQKDG